MSKDLPQPQQSEEVDLGQLFKLIGNAFNNFFRFIGSLFNKLFLAFVWLVFFVKKHILKLVIAGVIGIVLGIVLEKTSEPVYKSSITLKQNYDTGENLYNTIGYYNDLLKQGDLSALESVLGIRTVEAESILNFEIESVISENEKLQEFDAYLKTLDTSLVKNVEYKTFLKNSKDHNHQYQEITIKAKERNNFKTVFDKIIDNINSNSYFKREHEKDLKELREQALAISKSLIKSDTLLAVYQKAIVKSAENNNDFQAQITIERGNKSSTKEFDLYTKDLQLRKELVEIEREIADKEHIIEITSSKQDSGTIDNSKDFLGKSVSPKIYYVIILMGLTFITLLCLRAVKFLERYKDKI
ncbi:hypothetical protein Q4Q39_17805 [Flavivirga amylovorans]|uniref:Polysaccharide chain length determinant N-terminal domain-containing protein n=1 Tax=Flavivirga amylovorans TaxID=870486 RepID=A0ABT8X5J0_9FLAO|nr:hypothetical protein [Flavivirga amylovorans]MDO5989263.1 hypothetical protein [Flavivirga amylovorans]